MTDRKEGSQNSSLRSSYVPPPTNKSGITVGNVEDYESVHRDRRTTINHEALKQDFSKLDKELRLASHWLAKPIECGYLLAFSRTEYNSENVRFLMAMENFKDHMDTDQQAWSSDTWQEIDRRVEIDKETHDADLDDEMLWDKHLDSKLWPSAKIAIDSVSKHVQLIWDNFFSSAASSEICISAKMRARTVFRLRHLHLYGREVFTEATIDPLKTVNKDVLPRFLVSGFYQDLDRRLKSIVTLPAATDFTVKPPRSSAAMKLNMNHDTLDDIRKIPWKNDRILYQAFHDYLKSIFAVELVYCVRSIVVYQQLWTDKKKSGMNHTEGKVGDRDVHHEEKDEDPPSFDDAAWKIYSYFVASGSVYEVSVSSRRRREIQQQLATPTIDMFDRLQEQTYTAIGHHLDRFYTSNFFQSLPDVIRQEQIDQALRREMRQKMHHGVCIPTPACIVPHISSSNSSSSNSSLKTRPVQSSSALPSEIPTTVFGRK